MVRTRATLGRGGTLLKPNRDGGPDGGERPGIGTFPSDDGGRHVVQVRHPIELRPSAARSTVGAGAGCHKGGERIDGGEPAGMGGKAPGHCPQRRTQESPCTGDGPDGQRADVDRQRLIGE
ncbi:hypothetical protein QF031_001146 [Pseudarthrobacter defluvii]|uniref:hypothetical protein n=1 Tax=Pseudarthrobacter defluvii TaxID=410837 RepID=UPI002782FB73|nr:hypothetical protein [Pseudarthrobacter defluvii]MDQ0768397.1 hypothetical protein [Pseudarthrobacter defluvii]